MHFGSWGKGRWGRMEGVEGGKAVVGMCCVENRLIN